MPPHGADAGALSAAAPSPLNTPLPNVAWAFPSILRERTVLKPSEHTPVSAWWLGRLCLEAGLPPGVLNVLQGLGPEAGMPLVQSSGVDLVSFTGSAATGRGIAEAAGRRLAKTVMELGGKNALVVCHDADLDRAAEWTLASAFSNAGQRCAAASRIVVDDAVYGDFRARLLRGIERLDPIGPVISEASMERILRAVGTARSGGATVIAGGARVGDAGWHVAPTWWRASCRTLRARSFSAPSRRSTVSELRRAVGLATTRPASPQHLAASTAPCSSRRVAAGVVVVNADASAASLTWASAASSRDGVEGGGVEALDVLGPGTSTPSSTPSSREPCRARLSRCSASAASAVSWQLAPARLHRH
jgi:aldehyde dehydrogenase (NAD+)